MKIESTLTLIIVIYSRILTVSSQDYDMDPRIVGGTDASTKDFPFYIHTILFVNNRGFGLCGATYISSLWVLTAAHCIVANVPGTPTIFVELYMELDVYTDRNTTQVQVRRSSRLVAHPNYSTGRAGMRKDLGLIKIQSPFKITEKAKIATIAGNQVNYDGTWLMTLVGYGKRDIFGKIVPAEKLQMIVVPIWKRYDCQFSIKNKDVFCVGKQGSIACSGDSGGPAIHKGVVFGVTSFILRVDGDTCASVMSVYEDVSKHLRWIRKHVPDIKTSDARENHIGLQVIWIPFTLEILNLVSKVFH